MQVNFFTFKWGTKYGPEYVNRLYGSLVEHCHVPFSFTVITDDYNGISEKCNCFSYKDWDIFDYDKEKVWTREKLILFKRATTDYNCWLDLDVLIHDDITDLVTRDTDKPYFIWNYWNQNGFNYGMRKSFGRGTMCFLNSSFVTWKGDSAEWLFDYTWENRDKIFWTYNSLDKYLFYQHWRNNRLGLHEEGIFYNYNFGDETRIKRPDYKVCLFNSSHIKRNNIKNQHAYELHDAGGWATELWKSYDSRY